MSAENNDYLTIHMVWERVLAVLRRRRSLVLLTAASTVIAVYVCLLFVSDKYEVQANLLVMLGRENTEVPVTVDRGTVVSYGVKKEEIDSEISLLASAPMLTAAIDDVGLSRFQPQPNQSKSILGTIKYAAKATARWGKEAMNEILIRTALRPRLSLREKARLMLERSLQLHREKDSSVIKLHLRMADPVLGRDVLDALINNYLRRRAEAIGQGGTVALLLEEQAQAYGNRLSELRDQSSKLKAELGVTSVKEEKLQLLEMLKSAELEKLESELELTKLRAEQGAVLKRRPELEEQLATSRVVSPSVYQTRVKELLADLRLREAQAIAKYSPVSEPVKKIEEQILAVQCLTNQLPDEDIGPKTYTLNPVVAHLDLQQEGGLVRIAALEAGAGEAKNQIARIKSSLQKMDSAETELQKLQLEVSVLESRYVANASKREEARSEAMLDRARVANIFILSPPFYSEKPAAPKRLLIVILAAITGVLGGISLGLLYEWRIVNNSGEPDLHRLSPHSRLVSLTPDKGQQPPAMHA